MFRPDVIASVAYTPYCASMIRRLGQANLDLIPIALGDLIIEGVVQSSHICFVRYFCMCSVLFIGTYKFFVKKIKTKKLLHFIIYCFNFN